MTNQADTAEATAPDLDKVIARIQKLLSRTKTDRGSTEAEADTAMKMAQELMLKHNLDLAVVEAAAGANSGVVERVKEEVKGKAMYKWQRQLAKYVAEANFCYHIIRTVETFVPAYYKSKGKKQLTREEYLELSYEDQEVYERVDGAYKTTHSHVFVGRKANVITAQMMYQYLTSTIEDLVPVTSNAQRMTRSAMSWKEGCGDRLCERLAARRKDLIARHDAAAQAQQADSRAEYERRAKEAQAKTPKQVGANHETEVKNVFDDIASEAYNATGPVPEADEPDRPEEDSGDEWTPAGQDVVEAPTGSAMVLASMYDASEREANYEIAHGYKVGQLAQWRAERAAEIAAQELEEASKEAKEQVDAIEAPVKQETERQRVAREKREDEEHAKNRRRWAREDQTAANKEQRAYAKRDHRAYNAGAEKGKDIGLDTQIARSSQAPKKLS